MDSSKTLFPSEHTSSSESISSDHALLAKLRLALVSGVGPRLRQSLLDYFGSYPAIFEAALDQLREVQGIGPKISRAIADSTWEEAQEELSLAQRSNIHLTALEELGYPAALAQIPDPPGVLYLRGELLPQDEMAVAIVGSRHATHYGLTQAERLAGGLARAGVTIVSGLARGIDAAAHRGALAAGGRTLAVLGSGLLNLYPPEHDKLADEIACRGAVISEVPLKSAPMTGSFPQRNRIISGLSLGVIVVEASNRSGALISARHAMEQGREVFAVPGRIDSRMSHGCHQLIRDGAKLVETIDDVLEELGPPVRPVTDQQGQQVHHPGELLLNEHERQLLETIGPEPKSVDQLVVDSGLETSRVLATIGVLEIRRLIRRLPGNLICRV